MRLITRDYGSYYFSVCYSSGFILRVVTCIFFWFYSPCCHMLLAGGKILSLGFVTRICVGEHAGWANVL